MCWAASVWHTKHLHLNVLLHLLLLEHGVVSSVLLHRLRRPLRRSRSIVENTLFLVLAWETRMLRVISSCLFHFGLDQLRIWHRYRTTLPSQSNFLARILAQVSLIVYLNVFLVLNSWKIWSNSWLLRRHKRLSWFRVSIWFHFIIWVYSQPLNSLNCADRSLIGTRSSTWWSSRCLADKSYLTGFHHCNLLVSLLILQSLTN